MKAGNRKIAIIVCSSLILFCLSGLGLAQKIPLDWFEHNSGRSRIAAYSISGEEETPLLDGLFMFEFPDDFYVDYYLSGVPVSITSHAGFVEMRIGEEQHYGYDQYWVFQYFQEYVHRLAEFSRLSLEYSGVTNLADQSVVRYFDLENTEVIYWFDQQTGLPLFIRQGKETLLSVSGYTFDANVTDHYVLLKLDLFFGEYPAQITLVYGENGWTPSRLKVVETHRTTIMEFSEWIFNYDWVQSKVANLKELNERFLEEYAQEEWSSALGTSQKMLVLAPQFWQAYLFQAFAYEKLDNFLGVVENYQQVLMRDPTNHLALNNLAYHYFLREVQISQALEMAERAVELEPREVYLDTLGYGYYLVGRYDEALELLEKALATAPEKAKAEIEEHLNLVLQALGQRIK